MKVMALRRSDHCTSCSASLPSGTVAVWDQDSRAVRCLACAPQVTVELPHSPAAAAVDGERSVSRDLGGASAQREYDRRARRREDRIRAQHARLGGLILALSDEPSSTRVWAQGARGERAVAARLDGLAGAHVSVLHDRRMRRPDGRRTRANIDHIAVAASGVWVIDAKTHTGKLEVRRSGGLLSRRVEALYIGGRQQTKLLQGLAGQVEAVSAQLAQVNAQVAVRGALCFVGTELPWFGERIGDVPLVGRRGLAKLLKAPGHLVTEERDALAQLLALRFPSAD